MEGDPASMAADTWVLPRFKNWRTAVFNKPPGGRCYTRPRPKNGMLYHLDR